MDISTHSTRSLITAATLVVGGAMIGYSVGAALARRTARLNNEIQMQCEKVVDQVDIEDITERKSFCRCWKSKKWPYCDGAHKRHNQETGDNVGPLRVTNAAAVTI